MRFPERELTNDRYTSVGTLPGLCGFIHAFPVRRDLTANPLKIDFVQTIDLVEFFKTITRKSWFHKGLRSYKEIFDSGPAMLDCRQCQGVVGSACGVRFA
jgi:hypothetical protein